MASTSATATIRLGVDLASLQTGLRQAATIAEQKGQSIKAALMRATDSGVDGFKNMGSSIASALNPINLVTGALGSMTATLGIGAGAAGLGGMIAASITAAESMADLSIKTGIQVEQLSRFSSIAKLSGTSMEDVAGIVKKLSISAVDAYSGNDKLARSFDAIGISTKELKSISPDELLIRVAQGIQGIDPMIVQDLMAQLGGKSASNVLPFLRELTERIDQTGVKISTQFAKDAKDFSDNVTLMKSGVMALANQMTSGLLPSINAVLSAIVSGEPIWRSFFASAVDWGGNLPAQLAQAELKLREAVISRNESDDPGVWEDTIKRYELRVKMLQDRIGSVKSSLNPDIDPAKNEAARRAAAENNKSGATAGDGFLKGLKDRIEKAEQGEYAMLRLQAAEKGVSSAAGPLIDQLKQLDEAKSVSNYEDNLVRQNAEIEFQNSLIGRSAAEVAMLNIERKAELELAKQIEQIERAKGALSDESIAKMQAATEASIAIQKASISSRLEMERTWQTGATTSLQKYLDSAENIAKGTEDAFTRAFKGVEDAFVSLAMTGSLNFTNLTNSIIADIIRLQARAATAGLANFLTKSLTSMFSASLPDASGQHSVQGNADYVYDLHTGGIAGNGGSGRYLRDMRIFEDAPRYHSGGTIGLKPDEVPAILQRGERVLPRGAQIDNSVPVNIVVNNNGSSAQATAQDRGTDGFGTRQIEIMITDIVAKGMATGRLDTAMQSAFNIRRAGK